MKYDVPFDRDFRAASAVIPDDSSATVRGVRQAIPVFFMGICQIVAKTIGNNRTGRDKIHGMGLVENARFMDNG
uniref:hypothetical protein n=1 Tax=Komagataeibacter xylinus TaxID=28448 RepID=UPI000A4DE4D5|nr:hypothetical protein [Komagataeibacter xylinus]